jgi:hypothetical protein
MARAAKGLVGELVDGLRGLWTVHVWPPTTSSHTQKMNIMVGRCPSATTLEGRRRITNEAQQTNPSPKINMKNMNARGRRELCFANVFAFVSVFYIWVGGHRDDYGQDFVFGGGG